MIESVRCRAKVEKNFLRLKKYFSLAHTYTRSEKAYNGKCLLHFSLVLLNALYFFWKRYFKIQSNFTITAIISELHKYKIQFKKYGALMPIYYLNTLQKEIFLVWLIVMRIV